ncbi:TPA: beta-N-acetylglucosaminidase domain-containing protein [Streptococcus suis]
MKRSSKDLFDKRYSYSIRRLSVGTASVVVGCMLFGSQMVQANTVEASDPSLELVTDETEELPVIPEEEAVEETPAVLSEGGEVGQDDGSESVTELEALEAVAAEPMLAPAADLPQANESEGGETREATAQSQDQVVAPASWTTIHHYNQVDQQVNFDQAWKFSLGETAGASAKQFDDSSWQVLDLPHDFSLIQDYTQSGEAESGYKPGGTGWYRKAFTVSEEVAAGRVELQFDGAYMETEVFINGTSLGVHPNGYSPFTFDLTGHVRANEENIIAVKVVNPVPSSRWYSGSGIYRSVHLNMTPKVHLAEYGVVVTSPNLKESRTGQGTASRVEVVTALENAGSQSAAVTVRTSLFERLADGKVGTKVAEKTSSLTTISSQTSSKIRTEFDINNLKLWSVSNPHLYIVRTEILDGATVVQSRDQETGFRYIEFDNVSGFKLNGEKLKLQGVSMHHDQGGLGARAYYDAIERQFEILKGMGVNAVRVTHNPAARAMKDIANRMGMLLIDEAFDTWERPKNSNVNDYSRFFNRTIGTTAENLVGARAQDQQWSEFHVKQMVKSGINDPSIIMWSTGNEVLEGISGSASNYVSVINRLIGWINEVDPTRPATIGDNKLKHGDRIAVGMGNVLNDATVRGIVGYNYADGSKYDESKANHPNWIIYGSETASSVNSRGVYNIKGNASRSDKQRTAYDQSHVNWGHTASQAWYDVITRDFVAGEFVWTGFDYLGEPTPWNGVGPGTQHGWPAPKSSYFGIVDTAGFPKDSYYFYRSQWKQDDTTLHVLPAWNDAVLQKDSNNRVEVVVYSNAAKVQLVHIAADGTQRDLGTKEFTEVTTDAGYKYKIYNGADKSSTPHKNLYLTWQVDYQPGTIKAIAYDAQGNVIEQTVGSSQHSTFGTASKLLAKVAKVDQAVTDHSLAYIEIDVVDANNNLVVNAANPVSISVSGPAKLVAMDNGNAMDHQSYQADNRKAFAGKVLAIVQMTGASGTVSVTASADGLTASTVEFAVTGQADQAANKAKEYKLSKNIYIKRGAEVNLPTSVTVRFQDGSEAEKAISFDKAAIREKLATEDTVTARARVADLDLYVSLLISVIDQVAAIKNVATAVEIGSPLVLPQTVEAFLADGTLLSSQFPVTWTQPSDDQLRTEGVIEVRGVANVLGDQLPVTAKVRVGNRAVTIGGNVAPKATRIEQDIPQNLQSDTLMAIVDGGLQASANNDGGANETIWSNYDAAQADRKTATLSFVYDTAQNIAEVSIYYHRDNWSLRQPKSVTFSYQTSSSAEATVAAHRVTETKPVNGLTKVTYRLDRPVSAEIFKVTVENSDEVLSGRKPSVGIVELELKTALEAFVKSSDASINEIQIGNQVLRGTSITNNMTVSGRGDITARNTANNVGVTVLRTADNTVKIVTSSEDGSQSETYTLTFVPDSPTTEGRNYIERSEMTLTAGSVENRASEAVDNAKDFNLNSHWHSAWSGTDISNLWLTVDTGRVRQLNGLAYRHRQDGSPNGKVTSYDILVSTDNRTWTSVKTGSFDENNRDWQEVSFDPTSARYIKLQAVNTLGDGGRPNRFMSASEVRVSEHLGQVEAVALTSDHVRLASQEYAYTGQALTPKPTVRVNGIDLVENQDYRLDYSDNIGQVGTSSQASVRVTGLGRYTGVVSLNFTIRAGQAETVSDGTIETAERFDATRPASAEVITAALASEDYLNKNYQVFPTPQTVTYGDGLVALNGRVNLVIGQGVDIYTRNRLKDTLQAHQISYATSTSAVEGATNIYIGIHGQAGLAQSHQANAGRTAQLFDKIDAYRLVVKDNAISVIGKDTDAVFFGLTTLKHMLNDSPAPVLREVDVEDFADIKNRGFIEGYYGNPWSTADRMELMRYGGDLKLTQYFFAPKDDEYHNSRWRELYPEDKLEEIRQMARVGNQNKTRYVWTLHPFMHNSVRFGDENHYREDLEVIKRKFTQLMGVGVREFGILADDARHPAGGFASYNRLMADLTQWLESQQAQYTGLRKEMIFVPHEYWGDGDEAELRSLNENLPESASLTVTGGRIWGQVSNQFLTTLSTNLSQGGKTYRPVQLWINWPCTDNSKEHLILGGGEKFLQPNVDASLIGGIMLNPMQQSEPSKIALFSAAEYTWNIWESEEAAKRVNDIAFNFVETGRFTDSETSLAFRELGKHMINQNMDGRVVKLEESLELAPKLAAFRTKLEAGEDLTEDRRQLRAEFAKLKAAAQLYKESGNELMRNQIHYWLDNTIDQMDALESLLTATEFIGSDQADQLWNHYNRGLGLYEQSKGYTFWYVNHYEKAELGVQHIRPFILHLLEFLAGQVESELYPDRINSRLITNRSGAEGSVANILDGDLSTQLLFKNPNTISTGDYVGLEFNKTIDLDSLTFAMGAVSNLRDTFSVAAIQYQTEDGEWLPIPGHTYTGSEALLTFSNLGLKAKAVRMIATSDKANTWFGIRDIAVNKPLEASRQTSVAITHSNNLVYKGQTSEAQIKDGNDATEAMFANANTASPQRDTTPAEAWVQLDLGQVKPISKVRLAQGTGDKINKGVLEYSVNGTDWTNLTSLSGEQLKEVSQEFEAQYIRVRNTENLPKWWRIKDFSVETNEGRRDMVETSIASLENSPVFETLGSYRLPLPATTQLAPGDFVGIKLDRLHELESLQATGSQLDLVYSPNAVEWYQLDQVSEQPLARYIRLINKGQTSQVLGSSELLVETKEIHPDKLKSTTLGINQVYGNNDVRRIKNLDQLFDGVYNNFVEFADVPRQGGEIVLELGVQRPIRKIRAYIQDGTKNYLRDGKIQVSQNGQDWVDIVTVGDGQVNASRDDSLGDGWTHDSNLPGNRYIEGSLETPVTAKYLRIYFTANYDYRFVGFTEMVINDGEFVKTINDPTVTGDSGEAAKNLYTNLVDRKVLSSYKPAKDQGHLVYHLSEKTEVNHVKLISSLPEGSSVQLRARVIRQGQDAGPEWVELGSVTNSLQTFVLGQDVAHLLDLDLSWTGGRPELYELSTYHAEIDQETPIEDQPTTGGETSQPDQPTTGGETSQPDQPTTGGETSQPDQPTTGGETSQPDQPTTGGETSQPDRPTPGGETSQPGSDEWVWTVKPESGLLSLTHEKPRLDILERERGYGRQVLDNPDLQVGVTRLVQVGKVGKERVFVQVVTENGVVLSQRIVHTMVLEEAQDEILEVGRKPLAPQAASQSATVQETKAAVSQAQLPETGSQDQSYLLTGLSVLATLGLAARAKRREE